MTHDEIETDLTTWLKERPQWLQSAAFQIINKGHTNQINYEL
jgi:hypothetical protein